MPTTKYSAAEHEQMEEALEYWTPERMASAVPVDLTEPDKGPLPGKFITDRIENPADDSVHRRAGRLYVSLDGYDVFCSASAINNNGILTAAHSLYNANTQKFADKGIYSPAWNNGVSRYGTFPLTGRGFIPDAYQITARYQYDYGFSKVGPGGPGPDKKELGSVTGHFELRVSKSTEKQWDALGYPSVPVDGYQFNGQRMWRCLGDRFFENVRGQNGKEGNFTEGSSGGPWLMPGTHFVTGIQVMSTTSNGIPVNVSPYFDEEVIALYNKAFNS